MCKILDRYLKTGKLIHVYTDRQTESTQPVPLIIYIVYTILCGVFLLGVKSFVTNFIYTVQGDGEAFNSVYRHLRRFLEGIRRSSVAK